MPVSADTLRASAARLSPWTRWLVVAAVASLAWSATPGGPGDVALSCVGSGTAVLMVHLAVTWGRRDEHLALFVVGLLGAFGWVGFRLSTGWLPGPRDTLGAAGVALLLFLAYRARTRQSEEARVGGDVARVSVVFVLLTAPALALAYATTVLLPQAWDAPALTIDGSFPIHAFHVGLWLARWPVVRTLASFVYEGIFFFIPALAALRLRLPTPPAVDLVIVTIVTCLVGQIFYFITPIVGPAFAFQLEFPYVVPSLARLPRVALDVPREILRNGMPSLHTAWALVFLWNTRPLGVAVRVFGVLVLLLTVVSTLGLGQHYVIDLVAAVPYAAAAQALGTKVSPRLRRARLALIGTNGLLVLAWVLAPRFAAGLAVAAPGVVVAVALATVVVASFGERWLAVRVEAG